MSSASGSKPQAGALFAAITANDEALVQSLLDDGADVNEQEKMQPGLTPLHWAVVKKAPAIADLLLSRGADIELRDRYGATPLHWAARRAYAASVALLLRRGASVHARTNDGNTPLHWAASDGHTAIAELLIEAAAPIDATNSYGHTPLYDAAFYSQIGTTALLLALGANVDDATKALLCRNFSPEKLKAAVEKLQTQTHPLIEARALKDRRAAAIVYILQTCILHPESFPPPTNATGDSGSRGGRRASRKRKRKATRRRRATRRQ